MPLLLFLDNGFSRLDVVKPDLSKLDHYRSLGSDAFATLHNGRIVGALDAGEAQFDVSRLEDEPCYVSGVGFAPESPGVPSIVFVFAIGRTTAQALTRGCAVFESFDVPAKPHFVLKVARIAPIDGQLLRSVLERARDTATGKSRRALEVGLGEQDHLVAAGECFWSVLWVPILTASMDCNAAPSIIARGSVVLFRSVSRRVLSISIMSAPVGNAGCSSGGRRTRAAGYAGPDGPEPSTAVAYFRVFVIPFRSAPRPAPAKFTTRLSAGNGA